jgi:hypothetical protein
VQIAAADNFAANLLPIIQAIRAEGATTLDAMTRAINLRGIRTVRGARWHVSPLSNLLARTSKHDRRKPLHSGILSRASVIEVRGSSLLSLPPGRTVDFAVGVTGPPLRMAGLTGSLSAQRSTICQIFRQRNRIRRSRVALNEKHGEGVHRWRAGTSK